MSDTAAALARVVRWVALPTAIVAGTTTRLPLVLAVVIGVLFMLIVSAVAFAMGDADIGLLTRGKLPALAYSGKVCIIVGGSRGFGEALAMYLARSGASLVLCARGTAQLKVVKEACDAASPDGQPMYVVPVDVTGSEGSLKDFVDTVVSTVPRIDYCFLAAGSSQSAAAEEINQATAHEIMDLNAIGVIDVGRAILPCLIAQGHGQMVVIASMAARVPSPGQAEYSASKHALLGYFASVAAEVADRGVGITIACPGPIAGASIRSVFGPFGKVQKEEEQSGQTKKIPMERCCELVSRAAASGVQEAWIARHPILFMGYLTRYWPSVAELLLRKIGPKRVRALKEGKSGYSFDLATADKKAT